MTYEIAQVMSRTVTYGWLITQTTTGGPADKARLGSGTQQALVAGQLITIGGDIITAINGAKITNLDSLSTYLEEHTLPDQTINVTTVRNNQTMDIDVKLEPRPP